MKRRPAAAGPEATEEGPARVAALEAAWREESGAADSPQALGEARARMLGRQGRLAAALRALARLEPAERRRQGALLNALKARVEAEHVERLAALCPAAPAPPRVDVTLPGRRLASGAPHPARALAEEIVDILTPWGFEEAFGPEVEHDWYNFTALNMPPDHPARDMQDTFFLGDEVVLRTHTSNVQVRTLLASRPPVRKVAPGMVFRRDEIDATHSPVFHQVEGLWVDEQVSMADLKGVIAHLVGALFGRAAALRLRPSYFPFTEPSLECDIACVACEGRPALSCRICRGGGWLEILGAGMVDPAVLEAVDLDPERFTGFAFGLGVERICMLRHGIADMRGLFDNDVRLLAAAAGLAMPGGRPPA